MPWHSIWIYRGHLCVFVYLTYNVVYALLCWYWSNFLPSLTTSAMSIWARIMSVVLDLWLVVNHIDHLSTQSPSHFQHPTFYDNLRIIPIYVPVISECLSYVMTYHQSECLSYVMTYHQSECLSYGEFQTEVSLRLILSNRSRNKPGNKTRIRHCFYKDNLHLITRNVWCLSWFYVT
jgi:hypothetical protein